MHALNSLTKEELRQQFYSLNTQTDVSRILGVSIQRLTFLLYRLKDDQKYSTFEIAKKSGGRRSISSPIISVKRLQRVLSILLGAVYDPKPSVHGFVFNRSVVTNAQPHVGQTVVLNLDLVDFFSEINFGRIRGMFMALPYSRPEKVATLLAQLCCCQGKLPQGSPCSPIVANMVCARLDTQMQKLARNFRSAYSRYADDITISTSQTNFSTDLVLLNKTNLPPQVQLGGELVKVISSNGFQINKNKVRLQFRHNRQEVTGLIVNVRLNVNRTYLNQLRAMLHAWEKFGYAKAEMDFQSKYCWRSRAPHRQPSKFRQVVYGKLNYLSMVRGVLDSKHLNYAAWLARIDRTYEVIYNKRIRPQLGSLDPSQAIWVVENESNNSQGTAFYLEGVGLITCAHVLPSDLSNTFAFQPNNPNRKFDVDFVAVDRKRDLAILKFDCANPVFLKRAKQSLWSVGDEISLYGFPNYAPGHTIQNYTGKIAGKKKLFENDAMMVSTPIMFGNSGGPILNQQNEVIGVAATGADSVETLQDHESGAFPIESLDALLETIQPKN